ncbi:hypothetical protein [Sinorhizobium medicae]
MDDAFILKYAASHASFRVHFSTGRGIFECAVPEMRCRLHVVERAFSLRPITAPGRCLATPFSNAVAKSRGALAFAVHFSIGFAKT